MILVDFIHMDDNPADSCAIRPMAFLLWHKWSFVEDVCCQNLTYQLIHNLLLFISQMLNLKKMICRDICLIVKINFYIIFRHKIQHAHWSTARRYEVIITGELNDPVNITLYYLSAEILAH